MDIQKENKYSLKYTITTPNGNNITVNIDDININSLIKEFEKRALNDAYSADYEGTTIDENTLETIYLDKEINPLKMLNDYLADEIFNLAEFKYFPDTLKRIFDNAFNNKNDIAEPVVEPDTEISANKLYDQIICAKAYNNVKIEHLESYLTDIFKNDSILKPEWLDTCQYSATLPNGYTSSVIYVTAYEDSCVPNEISVKHNVMGRTLLTLDPDIWGIDVVQYVINVVKDKFIKNA